MGQGPDPRVMEAWRKRFFVVSPDHAHAAGYENHAGAEAAALAFGEGAHVVDTMAQPYHPALEKVEEGRLAIVGFGAFDFRDGPAANLTEAVRKGILPAIRAWLAKGADANHPGIRGETPLHWAVGTGNAEAVALLLAAGADPGRPDAAGLTPLALAEEKDRRAIVAMLKRRQSSPPSSLP